MQAKFACTIVIETMHLLEVSIKTLLGLKIVFKDFIKPFMRSVILHNRNYVTDSSLTYSLHIL